MGRGRRGHGGATMPALSSVDGHPERLARGAVLVGALAGLLAVGGLDDLTGCEVSISVPRLGPVPVAALHAGADASQSVAAPPVAGVLPMQAYAPISLDTHVALDYGLVALGLAAPWLLGFSHLAGATAYTLALAAFGLGLNLVSNFPGGLWKRLPFRWHRLVEWSSPPPFIVGPWLFFADAGAMPWVLSAIGTGILLNAALTRPAP